MPKAGPHKTDIHRKLVEQAYDNWCANFGASTHVAFWKFIGEIEELDKPYFDMYRFTDESLRKLNLLLSPHHRAISKAYKIQHKKLPPVEVNEK